MALNLTDVFTLIGRVGRVAYIIDSAQDIQDTPFNQFVAVSGVNPAWTAPLAQSYDPLTRAETAPMSAWVQAVTSVLQGLVAADNPAYGVSLSSSLQYLQEQMVAQGKTIAQCTIGSTVTPDSANVGGGVAVVTLVRGDGLSLQNTIAEESTLLITADSYTGGATVNREPWQWSGAPNVSSWGTGAFVNLWDFDWPQGSSAGAGGQAVAASQDGGAGVSQNYLTNGDFESWTGSAPAVLDYWYKETGTWGTSMQRSGATDGIDGGYCVQFNTGATLNALTQQFNTTTSDGTVATAGTGASVAAYTGYLGNMWLKAAGVISAGVMTVSLVDSAGTVINDQQGTPNTTTLALNTVGTSWENFSWAFRLPIILPADGIVRLKIKITTALAGANLLMDWVCFTLPTNTYLGGPNVAVFSNPAAPFEAQPDPDGFSLVFSNNRAGSSFGATFQTLVNRIWQTPGLILPYSGSPDFADTLITGV